MPVLPIAELTELAARALKRAGASKTMAEMTAQALVAEAPMYARPHLSVWGVGGSGGIEAPSQNSFGRRTECKHDVVCERTEPSRRLVAPFTMLCAWRIHAVA